MVNSFGIHSILINFALNFYKKFFTKTYFHKQQLKYISNGF